MLILTSYKMATDSIVIQCFPCTFSLASILVVLVCINTCTFLLTGNVTVCAKFARQLGYFILQLLFFKTKLHVGPSFSYWSGRCMSYYSRFPVCVGISVSHPFCSHARINYKSRFVTVVIDDHEQRVNHLTVFVPLITICVHELGVFWIWRFARYVFTRNRQCYLGDKRKKSKKPQQKMTL